MSTAKQRIIVLSCLAVLLIAAPILNYKFNKSTETNATLSPGPTASSVATGSGTVTTGNFFADYVNERESQRTDELKYLDGIINDNQTDAETKKTAQQQKTDIAKSMEMEMTVENLLKAKNFDRVAVLYHADSVNIIIGSEELTDAQVAQILDVARTETGLTADKIKIIPVK